MTAAALVDSNVLIAAVAHSYAEAYNTLTRQEPAYEARHKALDELVLQAQELDMGY